MVTKAQPRTHCLLCRASKHMLRIMTAVKTTNERNYTSKQINFQRIIRINVMRFKHSHRKNWTTHCPLWHKVIWSLFGLFGPIDDQTRQWCIYKNQKKKKKKKKRLLRKVSNLINLFQDMHASCVRMWTKQILKGLHVSKDPRLQQRDLVGLEIPKSMSFSSLTVAKQNTRWHH